MLLTDGRYRKVWDRVYDVLQFRPSIDAAVIPFSITQPYTVFDISSSGEAAFEQFSSPITEALIRCTMPGERIYALEWQSSAFLFDPRKPQQMKSFHVEDPRYIGGGYLAEFPSYYPDGDYYFFIDEQFRFGYLSHPWRKEVWIFGDSLVSEFEGIYKDFGWVKKENLQ